MTMTMCLKVDGDWVSGMDWMDACMVVYSIGVIWECCFQLPAWNNLEMHYMAV